MPSVSRLVFFSDSFSQSFCACAAIFIANNFENCLGFVEKNDNFINSNDSIDDFFLMTFFFCLIDRRAFVTPSRCMSSKIMDFILLIAIARRYGGSLKLHCNVCAERVSYFIYDSLELCF